MHGPLRFGQRHTEPVGRRLDRLRWGEPFLAKLREHGLCESDRESVAHQYSSAASVLAEQFVGFHSFEAVETLAGAGGRLRFHRLVALDDRLEVLARLGQ